MILKLSDVQEAKNHLPVLFAASRRQHTAPEASCRHQVSLPGELFCVISPNNRFWGWSYRLRSFLTEPQEVILINLNFITVKPLIGHHLYDPVACLNTSSHGSSIYMQKKRKRSCGRLE